MSTSNQSVLKTNRKPGVTPVKAISWYIVLFLLMLIGLIAFVIRAVNGLSTTNLSSAMPWGTWVAFYIYFVGMSAGAFLLTSLIHVFDMEHLEEVGKDATLVAIISMVLALFFILMDLGHMERFWHAIWYWNSTSILSWEIRFYTIYIVLLLAELYYALKHDKKKLKLLGAIGIPIAIFGVHGGTGVLFAVVKAQPYWNTALFPVIFVVSALVSGTALVTALYIIKNKFAGKEPDISLVKSLASWMVLFLVIDVGLQFFEILVGIYGLEEQELATLATIFTGSFALNFWVVQMGIGVIIPLILYFNPRTRQSTTAMFWAAVAVVIGILGVRFNIVVPALTVPVLPGLPAGYYYPSWIEWTISIGIISLGIIIYTLAVKLLPIDNK